jgi:hypothetical protein
LDSIEEQIKGPLQIKEELMTLVRQIKSLKINRQTPKDFCSYKIEEVQYQISRKIF